jgi:hypothetical protein
MIYHPVGLDNSNIQDLLLDLSSFTHHVAMASRDQPSFLRIILLKTNIVRIYRKQFLAAMSSSRSDVVTPSVRSFVHPSPYFTILENVPMEL